MRIAAAGCALAILVFLAVFGAVLAQKATGSNPAPTRVVVATPAPAPAEVPAAPVAVARTVTMPEPLPPAATGPVLAAASQRAPATTVPAPSPATAAPPAATPAPAATSPVPTNSPPPPAPTSTQAACPGNPNALGVARIVELDTTGGPGFGF